MRTRAEAAAADTLARFRSLTPVRLVGDILVMAGAILLDLWPGPWAETKASGWLLVAYVAVYVVLLPLRHVLPATVMIGAAAIPFGGPALMVLVSYTAGRRIESWLKAVVSTMLTFIVVVLLWDWDTRPLDIEPVYGMLILVTIFGVGVALPFLVGRYIAQREALVPAMQEREERMRGEHTMLSRQVRLRERSRIAQDMHDSLGHRLAPDLGARRRAGAGRRRWGTSSAKRPGAAPRGADRHGGAARGHRRAAAEDGPDEDPARRTVESIDALVSDARKAGVRVSLVRGGQAYPLPSRSATPPIAWRRKA